jgi:hypothetical protein
VTAKAKPTTTREARLICAHCQRPLTSRFEITQYNSTGAQTIHVNVCSLICLIQWAYRYASYQGQRGIAAIKNAFTQIGNALKGSNGK